MQYHCVPAVICLSCRSDSTQHAICTCPGTFWLFTYVDTVPTEPHDQILYYKGCKNHLKMVKGCRIDTRSCKKPSSKKDSPKTLGTRVSCSCSCSNFLNILSIFKFKPRLGEVLLIPRYHFIAGALSSRLKAMFEQLALQDL